MHVNISKKRLYGISLREKLIMKKKKIDVTLAGRAVDVHYYRTHIFSETYYRLRIIKNKIHCVAYRRNNILCVRTLYTFWEKLQTL